MTGGSSLSRAYTCARDLAGAKSCLTAIPAPKSWREEFSQTPSRSPGAARLGDFTVSQVT